MPLRIYIPLVIGVGVIGLVTRGESSDPRTPESASPVQTRQVESRGSDRARDRSGSEANPRAGQSQTSANRGRVMKEANSPREAASADERTASAEEKSREDLPKTKGGWKRLLSPESYAVTRCSATEPAFTGKYWNCKKDGIYRCVCCGAPLFDSQTKFDSGTGWPSFWEPTADERVKTKIDTSHGMRRIEVLCAKCGAHLGHVFPDGPQPTGHRYCINSAALNLDETRDDEPAEAADGGEGESDKQPDQPAEK